MDVGFMVNQCSHHGRVTFFGSQHQRRQLNLRLGRVRIRAALEKRLDSLRVAAAGSNHQHRLSRPVNLIRVGSGIKEPADHRSVPMLGSHVQGVTPRRFSAVSRRPEAEIGYLNSSARTAQCSGRVHLYRQR
jgi:hypothetical protein